MSETVQDGNILRSRRALLCDLKEDCLNMGPSEEKTFLITGQMVTQEEASEYARSINERLGDAHIWIQVSEEDISSEGVIVSVWCTH